MAGPVYACSMALRIRQLVAGTMAVTVLLARATIAAPRAIVALEDRTPRATFAVDQIGTALRARKYEVERTEEWRVDEKARADLVVRFALVDRSDDPQFEKLAPEGFLLRNVPLENHRELVVLSMDAAGAMYGGLELAEQ